MTEEKEKKRIETNRKCKKERKYDWNVRKPLRKKKKKKANMIDEKKDVRVRRRESYFVFLFLITKSNENECVKHRERTLTFFKHVNNILEKNYYINLQF